MWHASDRLANEIAIGGELAVIAIGGGELAVIAIDCGPGDDRAGVVEHCVEHASGRARR